MGSKLAAAAGVLAAMLVAASPAAAGHGRSADLQFRGQAIVPTGTTFAGTTVGGLSSITYDARRNVYYAISDDQGQFQPARFYTLGLDVSDGRLADGDVRFTGVTTLLAPDGQPYPPLSLDPEGLVLTRDRHLIYTSEGLPASGIDPFVRRSALDGTFLGSFELPQAFRVTADQSSGVRPNLGFESAGVTPDGRFLFTATENALFQDGPPATRSGGSLARILRYRLRSGRLDRQFAYLTDPVAQAPVPETAFSVNGVVELLPLDDDTLIAMERSFSVGAPGTGNTIRLYRVDLRGGNRPARKTLLLDLDDLGIPLDNVEGLTSGPRLRHGRRSLVLVSDNNFAATQFTQFLLFSAATRRAPPRGRSTCRPGSAPPAPRGPRAGRAPTRSATATAEGAATSPRQPPAPPPATAPPPARPGARAGHDAASGTQTATDPDDPAMHARAARHPTRPAGDRTGGPERPSPHPRRRHHLPASAAGRRRNAAPTPRQRPSATVAA